MPRRRRAQLTKAEPKPLLPYDPEAVTPATKQEVYPFVAIGIILGFAALAVCARKNYLLLYGDAVAHLGIARRIVDAHYPGMSQLGGVWLPLPHLLMLPFIGKMEMWRTGFAAVPMSLLSFAFSVAGIWRLARRLMRPRWALVAAAFYALNANLLYLSVTAMTEPLFLALLIWTTVAAMECLAALQAKDISAARGRMLFAGVLILLSVFTRYDGWVFGAAVWLTLAVAWWRSALRDKLRATFVIFTLLCLAGPLLWFWYNAHFEGDWLDFMRGPYSAAAIERKTAPPGQHYRGWHNPGWALLFYTRTAQIDAAAWETGFAVLAAALYGLWLQWRPASRNRTLDRLTLAGGRGASLLWVMLPFYVYSVTWGSVPIFIPQLWPHSYYNARYGMGMLPAFAVFAALAGDQLERWLARRGDAAGKIGERFVQPVALVLCAANCVAMMYRVPLVLKEGIVNAMTRQALEKEIAFPLAEFPQDQPVMMSVSAHVGAVQQAGRTLRSMVSEDDDVTWRKALADPAHYAAFVIAIQGDPVASAVAAHPEGLEELEVLCVSGQPCATVYKSVAYNGATAP